MSSNNENITEQETNSQNQQENFATEIFRVFQRQARTTITGLLLIIAVLVAVNAVAFVWNDHKWRELFSSYDFISQDGEGLNSVNNGIQGDLNFGEGQEN